MTSAVLEPPAGSAVGPGWDLMLDVQNGVSASFGVLYERYADSVFRFVRGRVPDHSQAEDLTSETFLRVLARVHTFSDRGTSVRALLFTVARNLVLDHAKSKYTRSVLITDELARQPRPARDDTEGTVLRGLQLDRVRHYMQRLTDDQRRCLHLRFVQGLTVAEAAAEMGRDLRALRQLQCRAVRRLAGYLRAEWS